MCVRPLYIQNPKIKAGTFVNSNDPSFIYVPCGRCYECLLAKQQEWIARNYQEYKVSVCSYYYTLTYNEESILKCPFIPSALMLSSTKKHTQKGFSLFHTNNYVRLFSPRKVALFLKRIESRFRRKGIRLRYFLVSELGEKTERPHHHIEFYLNKYVSPKDFYDIVSKCWTYGFIKPGDNFGLVNSPYSIYYVCKYISKNGKKKTIRPACPSQGSWYLARYVNRHFANFRRVSAGLGWHSNLNLIEANFIDNSFCIPLDGKFKKFPIPEYYKRKMIKESFVNKNGNVSYRPNRIGWNLMKKQFYRIYDNLQDKCELLNCRYGTDFSADEIMHYRLLNGLPLSKLKFSFADLYCQRHINNGYIDTHPVDLDNRYYIDDFCLNRLFNFNRLNQVQSYENYKITTTSYNLKQRLLYGKNKKEVKLLNFNEYVFAPA